MPQSQEEEQKDDKEKQEVMHEDEINLLDYFIVLAKHKRLIIYTTLGAAIITAIISLIMDPIYKAESKILPSQLGSSSLAMGMLGQMTGFSDIAGSALGMKTPSDLYVDMLKSRTIADRIIDRFDLMKLYDSEYRQDARKTLLKDVVYVDADKKSGTITIQVEDKDPKRASDMANAFVEELKKLTQGLAITEASQRRLFFEEQLKATKDALTKSEEDFKVFQEQTGALKVEDQAKAVIDGIANLMAQIAAKEVEIKVMRTYSTSNNPDLQKAEESLRGMKVELKKLEAKGEGGNSAIITTGRIPQVGTEYVRKMRETKFNEALLQILAQQYEAAKLDEVRDAAVIQVVDKAIPPEKKAKPKRKLMVIIAMFTGFFFSIFAAFFMEYKEKVSSNPENKDKIEILKRYANFRFKG